MKIEKEFDNLGDALRFARWCKGWSIPEAAMNFGVNKTTISRLERNQSKRLNVSLLKQHATAYNLDLVELINLVDK